MPVPKVRDEPEPVVASRVVVPAGRVALVVAVEVRVVENAPEVISELPLAKVRVALVAGAVIVTLLMLVADATPRVGVVNDGPTSGA